MSTRAAVVVIVLVWLVPTMLFLTPGVVRPDGAGYLVYLPSTHFDRDLLFFDEWQELGMVRNGVIAHKEVTATNHLGNHWTVGSALVWWPAFAVADVMRGAVPRNGFALPYNVAVVATSALAGLITLLAGAYAARRVATTEAAQAATVAIWLGTPLLWYSLVHATMSHAISAMACALVFASAVWNRSPFLTGLAAGLAFSVRPQNAPVAFVPLIVNRFSWTYVLGVAIGALPQLVVSTFVYGNPLGFVTGGSSNAFAAFERIWTWEPLFSWYHGLFTWSPVALLGLIGVVLLWRRDRKLAVACLMLFVAEWFINATLERSFWGAMAFGQRRFDNCIVVFLIGCAAFADRVGRVVWYVTGGLAALWGFALFLAARSGMDLIRYLTPGEIAGHLTVGRIGFLGGVPETARGRVLLFMTITFALFAIGALAIRFASRRAMALAAAVYFVAASLFLAYCGANGDPSRFAALIERNRARAGKADARYGLLRDELEYLIKSGRIEEARRTARELEGLR